MSVCPLLHAQVFVVDMRRLSQLREAHVPRGTIYANLTSPQATEHTPEHHPVTCLFLLVPDLLSAISIL